MGKYDLLCGGRGNNFYYDNEGKIYLNFMECSDGRKIGVVLTKKQVIGMLKAIPPHKLTSRGRQLVEASY